MDAAVTGAEFKKQLRGGTTKLGLFLNSHSPTVAEQLAHSGYDWLLVDTQHGPMGNERLSGMLAGVSNGGAISIVRVGGYSDGPASSSRSTWARTASWCRTSTRQTRHGRRSSALL